MKAIQILLAALLFSISGFAQIDTSKKYQPVPAPQEFRQTTRFNLPVRMYNDTPRLRNADTNSVALLGLNWWVFKRIDGVYRWALASGAGGIGSVTSVGIQSTNGTIAVGGSPVTGAGVLDVRLPVTGVAPGSYTAANITVDAFGRVVAAANGSAGPLYAFNYPLIPVGNNIFFDTNYVKRLNSSQIKIGADTISFSSGVTRLALNLAPEYWFTDVEADTTTYTLDLEGWAQNTLRSKVVNDSVFIPKIDGSLDTVYLGRINSIGYALAGNGSSGNPLRIDSATLRGDYIRNQFAAKENKSARFTKVRLDSLYSTKIALGAIDPAIRNLIFIAIDTGSSPFEGYLHHKMGYRNRIVDRISRARGSHASPTSLIVGDPLYTEQISMYGSAGYTTPFTFHDIFLKSVPTSTTGTSIYQQWASGPSTTNMVLQLDSNGVKIGRGLPGFSGTYDSSKNTVDVVGSLGTRVRSVTGTAHTATTNDHTILVSADGGSSFVLTLPNPATAPRREYVIKRVDSTLNMAYVKPTAGKVEGLDSMFIDRFSWVTIQSDSVSWNVVSRSSDTRLDALEQARNGFSYYQEFISNALFTDGYIFGNASGAGAGVGRGVAVPAALQATNRPGITYVRAGTTTTGRSGFYSDLNFRDNIILGASTVVYENTIALPDLSDGTDRYQVVFGLHDVAGVNATDGVYFLYDEGGVSTGSAASGNWQIVTASAASRTFTTTSTAVAANTWYRLRIEINKTASEVRFYINGTLVGTHTATIPSGVDRGTIIQASINKSAGTNDRVFAIDYLLLNMRFNTPRY